MLNSLQIQVASTMVRELRVSLSNYFLYSADNNMAVQSIQRLLIALEGLFKEMPSVILGESEGRLVVEGTPLDEHTTGSTNMIKDLFLTHKIHSLTFMKGITTEEAKTLFSLLKPKGLPVGLSFSQALVQNSLEHIRANEKVFLAVGEGEVVMPAGTLPGGDQNLQEALEALQYFLQIFSRVKPDSNKQELARKLMENMGDWVKTEQSETNPGQGNASPTSAQAWSEVFGGFMSLKNNLAAAPVKDIQLSMEELLKKLVLLGEGQGIHVGEVQGSVLEQKVDSDLSPAAIVEPIPIQEFDPILKAIDEKNWEPFWDPQLEEKTSEQITLLQDPDKLEIFENFWRTLWEKLFNGDAQTQALCLRHLNRLQWNRMHRIIQKEGLRNLRKFISDTQRAEVFPIALTLAQDWIPSELADPDWEEIIEMTKLLKIAAEKRPPAFDKQNEAAKVALETLFCEPIIDSLLKRFPIQTLDGEHLVKLFTLLGNRISPTLFEKIEEEPVASPLWTTAADFLVALQSRGSQVFETWLEWPEKRGQVEKFLEIFKVKPLSGDMADYFERHWSSFSPAAQLKILEIAELWKRTDFRELLLDILKKPENPLSIQALQVLSKVGLEGDAQKIGEAVREYSIHTKEKELFWIKACKVIAELKDPSGLEFLMQWADKYKIMESKKNRSMKIRLAALEALSHFHNPQVLEFLLSLQKDAEKEIRPIVDQSLKSSW